MGKPDGLFRMWYFAFSFFFNDTATTEIYTLSLHDALPISPTMYALWMIMGESLERKFKETNNPKYKVDPKIAMLPIDVLGFRRGLAPLENLLKDNDLIDHPEMIQAKTRGIRALSGHAETTDLTNEDRKSTRLNSSHW